VNVVVTNATGSSTSTVVLAQSGPSLLVQADGKHALAVVVHADGSSDLMSSAHPAKAGEYLILFAVGLGPTNPSVPAGKVFTGTAQTTNTVSVSIGNVPANVAFSGINGFTGLYQINVQVPSAGIGDQSLLASVAGTQTQPAVYVTLQ
jgi:uncharacterized protein (TIGR03437 family)